MFMYFLLPHWVPAHISQPDTDQYRNRIAVQEATYHTGAVADLLVEPLNHIIGTDADPVFIGKITVPWPEIVVRLH